MGMICSRVITLSDSPNVLILHLFVQGSARLSSLYRNCRPCLGKRSHRSWRWLELLLAVVLVLLRDETAPSDV